MIIKEAKKQSMGDIIRLMPSLSQIKDDVHRWIGASSQEFDINRSEYELVRHREMTSVEPRYFSTKTNKFRVPQKVTKTTPLFIDVILKKHKTKPTITFKLTANIGGARYESEKTVDLYKFDSFSSYDYSSMYDKFLSDIKSKVNSATGRKDDDDKKLDSLDDIESFNDFCEYIGLDEDTLANQVSLYTKGKGATEIENLSEAKLVKVLAGFITSQVKSSRKSDFFHTVKPEKDNGCDFDKLATALCNSKR